MTASTAPQRLARAPCSAMGDAFYGLFKDVCVWFRFGNRKTLITRTVFRKENY